MTTIRMESCPPQVLASHMALLGLGAIVEQWCPARTVRVRWSGGMDPRPLIEIDGSGDGAAAAAVALRLHVSECSRWLTLDFPDDKGTPRALFSPRRGLARDRTSLEAYLAARRRVIDATSDALTMRFFGGLGEPSHWHRDRTGKDQPDWAASRLDMQPRNRGSELVTNRLRPIAEHLANVTDNEVVDRLSGRQLVDSLGDGFTATGFAPPGPFDSLLAWCAFWGLAALPVAPRATSGGMPKRSQTTARPDSGCWMPIVVRPTRMAGMRSLLADARLVDAGTDGPSGIGARAWLVERGVAAVVHFGFSNKGSGNASRWEAGLGTLLRTGGAVP